MAVSLTRGLARTPACLTAVPRLVACALVLGTSGTTAFAAEVTDTPPALRADVHLNYTGRFEQAGIEESGDTYAIRNTLRHDLGFAAEFAPTTGVVLHLGLPTTLGYGISYPAARGMVLDPVNGSGSFVSGQVLTDPPQFNGAGINGFWIGVGARPLSASYSRSLPVDLRIDARFRTPTAKGTIYGPRRGAAPGSSAFALSIAASSRFAKAEPYVDIDWVTSFQFRTDLVNAQDEVVANDVQLKDASTLGVRVGTEVLLTERPADGVRVALDIYGGLIYRGWSDRGSGVHLPSVLPISEGVPVTKSEDLLARLGAAVDYDINRWVGLRVGAEGQYMSPHRIEHLYAARTDGRSFAVSWNAAVVGRIRLKNDPL